LFSDICRLTVDARRVVGANLQIQVDGVAFSDQHKSPKNDSSPVIGESVLDMRAKNR